MAERIRRWAYLRAVRATYGPRSRALERARRLPTGALRTGHLPVE